LIARIEKRCMDVWAIVPVKSLQESKGRLAHLLSPGARAQLVRVLLQHVLATVQETQRITKLLVISGDEQVRQIAGAYGALTMDEQPPYGLNRAVSHAYRFAAESGADAVLILPADLPFATTADLDLVLDAGLASSGVVELPVMAICSDRRGDGSNALFLRPCVDFEFSYGPNSLQHHIHEAVERGYVVRLVNAQGLQFDLDIEEDWQAFQEQESSRPINNSTVRQFSS